MHGGQVLQQIYWETIDLSLTTLRTIFDWQL
jgi:hypothetical protein